MKRPVLTLAPLVLIAATATLVSAGCGNGNNGTTSNNGNTGQTQELSENITADRTLSDIVEDPDIADYRVIGTLNLSATVNVEPGVRIEFQEGAGFEVTGALSAIGTEAEPIIFTGANSTAGYWSGLKFSSESVQNELTWTTVSYGGGTSYAGTNGPANVAVSQGARLKITNSTFSNSLEAGITARMSADFTGFASNTFRDNTTDAMIIGADSATYLDSDSTFAGDNGGDLVRLNTGNAINEDASWAKLDVPYLVEVNLSLVANLTLEAGAILEVAADQHIQTDGGSIVAVGTAEDPVTIHGESETAGSWKGIRIAHNTDNRFAFCDIAHTGSSTLLSIGDLAAIGIDNSGSATVENCSIHDNIGFAIWNEGMLTASGNTFTNNTLGDIGQP